MFLRYLESVWVLGPHGTRNCVMAGAAGTEAVVTAGAGLSVNITSSRVWLNGKKYTVPAATNLALDAADPSDPRIDLIVAKLVSGSPAYAARTGTPDPDPFSAAAATFEVGINHVRVAAAATVPTSFSDIREFGAVEVDRVIATNQLDAGDIGSAEFMFHVEADGSNGQVRIGEEDNPFLSVSQSLDFIKVDPGRLLFTSVVEDHLDIAPHDFVVVGGAINRSADGSFSTSDAGDEIEAGIRLPKGATITRVKVRGNRDNIGCNFVLRLLSRDKVTYATTTVGGPNDNDGTGSIGDFLLQLTGLSVAFNPDNRYFVDVNLDGVAGIISFYGAEVWYTLEKPFDSY